MKFLSDKTLERLREAADIPSLEGTRYVLMDRVARGGMGVVYAVQDEKLGRRVALKVLDAPQRSSELARRLIREAQVLASLEHPGIVPVHDVGTLQDGRVFYTMKFVEGQRLDEYIQSVSSVAGSSPPISAHLRNGSVRPRARGAAPRFEAPERHGRVRLVKSWCSIGASPKFCARRPAQMVT